MTKVEIEKTTAKSASNTPEHARSQSGDGHAAGTGSRREEADNTEHQRAASPGEERPGEQADVMEDMRRHAEHDAPALETPTQTRCPKVLRTGGA